MVSAGSRLAPLPSRSPAGTWAAAARVLGRLVGVVVAVELAVALPLPVAEAAAVGAAELVGAAGGVLCARVAGSDSVHHLPKSSRSERGTVVPWLGCPNLPAAALGLREQQTRVVRDPSEAARCQDGGHVAALRDSPPVALQPPTPPAPAPGSPSPCSHVKPLLEDEDPSRVPSQRPGDPARLPGPVLQEIQPLLPPPVPRTPTTLRGLVRAVAAVVIVVADEVLGNALAVLAHELPLVARVVVHCEEASLSAPAPCSPAP